MKHHLMAYIDSLIKRDEHIFEFRAEERLNKAGTENGVTNYILQKLHEKGSGNFGIKIYSNRKIGVYRIEVFWSCIGNRGLTYGFLQGFICSSNQNS